MGSRGGSSVHRPAITLRPATDADWPTLRDWLRMPDVKDWWGSASAAEAEIRTVLETNSAIARIIEAGNEPIGYAHAIDATYWGTDLPDGMPPGTWDVDIFIASKQHRGNGAGPRAMDLLAEEVFGSTLALAMSVFVSVKNERGIRAYEKSGFRWVRVWDDPLFGPSWLMLRRRP